MNATITAAIITASTSASASFLIWWLAHRSKVAPPVHLSPSNTIAEPKRRTTDLSHKQISDAINAVPPLQRDAIRSSFVGAWVTWIGELQTANKTSFKDKVLVQLQVGNPSVNGYHLISCLAAIAESDSLLIAPQDSKIVVTGNISRIDEISCSLEDCKFEIPPKAAK